MVLRAVTSRPYGHLITVVVNFFEVLCTRGKLSILPLWLLAVHSGAERYGSFNQAVYLSLLHTAFTKTHDVIATYLQAQFAVHLSQSFEHSMLTNADLGAKLTHEGRPEYEASVVYGSVHLFGCYEDVSGV